MPGASRFVFIRSAEQLEDRNDLVERSNGILHIQQVPQDALRPVPVLRRASVHLLWAPGWPGHLPRPHLPLCRLLLAGLPHGLALGRLAGLTILHKNLHAPGFAGSGQSPPRGGTGRAFAGRRKDRVFSRFPLDAILCEKRPAATPSVSFFVWIFLRAHRFPLIISQKLQTIMPR